MRRIRYRACVATLLAAAHAAGQSSSEDWRIDPYTGLRPERMEALGYESFGPFPWGDGHGTAAIEALLGRGLLWVETAHFKIGCGLAGRRLPQDSTGRQVLYDDLKELHGRIRAIPARVSELDPWLSLHLYALRMERLHRDFCDRFSLAGAEDLGRKGKFLLLLLQTEADLGRYTATWCGSARIDPTQHWFPQTDNLLFVTAAAAQRGVLEEEDALHPHVVFGVVQNLLEGCCGYDRRPPLWFTEGLAHWYARRVDPRKNNFSDFDPADAYRLQQTDWESIVRGRVRHATDPPLDEILAWSDPEQMDLTAHAVAWSRTAFLMGRAEGCARFVAFCREHPPRSRYMPVRLVREWHERALAHAFGLDLEQLEARWRRHVLSSQRR